MKSLSDEAKEIPDIAQYPNFIQSLEDFQDMYEALKINHAELLNSSTNQLNQISKKLNQVVKDDPDQLLAKLALDRALILDHWTLAYMAEENLTPSQVRLVQGVDSAGNVLMHFEKYSNIILA